MQNFICLKTTYFHVAFAVILILKLGPQGKQGPMGILGEQGKFINHMIQIGTSIKMFIVSILSILNFNIINESYWGIAGDDSKLFRGKPGLKGPPGEVLTMA